MGKLGPGSDVAASPWTADRPASRWRASRSPSPDLESRRHRQTLRDTVASANAGDQSNGHASIAMLYASAPIGHRRAAKLRRVPRQMLRALTGLEFVEGNTPSSVALDHRIVVDAVVEQDFTTVVVGEVVLILGSSPCSLPLGRCIRPGRVPTQRSLR